MKKIKKNTRIIFFISLGILIVLIIIAYMKLGNQRYALSGSKVSQMSDLVNKVRKLEDNIQSNQNDILTLVQEYREKTGSNLLTLDVIDLSDEERLLLEEKISSESNISIKSLLSEILEKKSEILELNMHIKKIEGYLPKPHIVAAGENHYQIALDYLLNVKGIEKEEALELAERSLLFDHLVPGFKVWNFYSDGEFGTFISQGSASVSPNEIKRKEKKKLTDARDNAVFERDTLAMELGSLKAKKALVLDQINLLNEEKMHLIKKLEELNRENEFMVEKVNSLYYILDTRSNLVKGGVLKGGFLRSLKLQSVSPDLFSRFIDLRSNNKILIDASELNLKKIRNIRKFPKFYKEDLDFSVHVENRSSIAEITVKNHEKMKNERIVIAVE